MFLALEEWVVTRTLSPLAAISEGVVVVGSINRLAVL